MMEGRKQSEQRLSGCDMSKTQGLIGCQRQEGRAWAASQVSGLGKCSSKK